MDPKEQKQTPSPESLPGAAPVPHAFGGPEPDRYIRTFAGDMDVVARGGTPGLSPLKEKPPVVPVQDESTMPQAAPMEVAPETIHEDIAAAPASPREVAPIPTVPTAVERAEPETEKEPAGSGAMPLKTYANDFRQHLNETHASTATVLAAEQDAGRHDEPEPEPVAASSYNAVYIALGVLLVLIGSAGAFYAYSKYLATTSPIIIAPSPVAPIFVDTTDPVSGSGKELMQAIEQSVQKPLSPNTVRLLSLSAATSTNVLLSLGVPVPGIVVRNINDSGNMAGVVNTQGSQSPFFIESVDLYSATFSGMLSWEPTMQRDLAALYPQYPAQSVAAATSTATSTPLATSTPTAPAASAKMPGFRDEVVGNHDVRTYRDSLGRSVLLYGYWNQSTLIIARDPSAFAEILDRLATSHAQ